MANPRSEEELYLFIRGSPLSFNILGLVSETARGLSVGEISAKLRKMPPSVSRAVSKLVEMDLLESVSVGRNKYFKVKSGKNELVHRLIEDSVRTAPNPPMFKLLSLEGSVASVVAKELEEALGKRYDVRRDESISGKHLDHNFDILLHNSKKVGIQIIHASNTKALFERLGMWSDLRGTDVELIVLIVLGGMKQPYKSFFEALSSDKPRIKPILIDTQFSELDDNTVRQKIAEPIVEIISGLKRR
jgi:DNA-binding transcriptional ArsR family regulator